MIDKLEDDGAMLLMQEGGRPLDPLIWRYAQRRGWSVAAEMHAIKVSGKGELQIGWPAPSFLDSVSGCIEIKCIIFVKAEGTLKRRGLLGRQPFRVHQPDNRNFIFWRSQSRGAAAEVTRGKVEKGYRHIFEHPSDLATSFLQRLLPKRTKQLIFEPFACTAPACCSAVENGWRFIGCESNLENYKRGLRRLREAEQRAFATSSRKGNKDPHFSKRARKEAA